MNLLLRYAQVNHSEDIYRDYYESGLGLSYKPLSQEGIAHTRQFFKLPFKPERIITADTTACLETATILAEKFALKIEMNPALLNIKHDLNKLISKSEFSTPKGIEKLRRNFIRDLYENKLSEPRTEIITRMQEIKRLLDSTDKSVLITHGLALIVFKIYQREGIKDLSKLNSKKIIDYSKPFYGPLLGYSYPGLVDYQAEEGSF